MTSNQSKLLTTQQAADVIGCSVQHVRHLIRHGKLNAAKDCSSKEWMVSSSSARLYQKIVPKKGWKRGVRRKMS